VAELPDGPQGRDALAAGARVGTGYTVLAPLSQGAMGSVYRATDADGREVALKRLLDASHSSRFEIEARLLSQLRHPRVVQVLDRFEDESGQYVVMELVDGPDLAAVLRDRGSPGLPVDEALSYTLDTCEALRYVHQEHIVHRDVKPQNLIACARGAVLVDFGIARKVEGLTDLGTRAIGTPQYMAPEVLVGEQISARCDVYSVAATLWTLLTGRPPRFYDPTPLAEEIAGVTPELEQTVRAGLELQPEKRTASAEAFARALGAPLGTQAGESLAASAFAPGRDSALLESIVHAAAGVFEAAAASIALVDPTTDELVYEAAWGAGRGEVVGVRLPAGVGLAGAVVEGGDGLAVPDCRSDPRFQAQVAEASRYVPNTMLLVPLVAGAGRIVGCLSLLDRRSGEAYRVVDLETAELFADVAVQALLTVGLISGEAVA
jgi:Protein kinase domain/GAF domain